MSDNTPTFNFEYIPQNIDRSGIRIFQNSKDTFSLEYAIFNPKSVFINMYPIKKKSLFRNKGQERGIATIQQFATAIGLHQDFHKIKEFPIEFIFDLLSVQFQFGKEGPTFYSGGILGMENEVNLPCTSAEGFIDTILEILTDYPQFSFVQLMFRTSKIPKEYKTEEDSNPYRSQLRIDLQRGNVERRFNPSKTSIIEELGCFEFSPRILITETNQDTLRSKLERLSVVFTSVGLKVRSYPTFWRRFSSFQSFCINRKLTSPIFLDGYSLMNFICPPQKQFCHEGYSLIPNKSEYLISSGVRRATTQEAIDIGIPIISGKTSNEPLLIEGKDFNRHMAVFGMTGEGKSRFIYGLLNELQEKNVTFLIFDPKGEYLKPIQTFCDDFLYLKPGSENFPWGINIFHIPKNDTGENLIPIEDHIQFVVSILENIFEDSDAVSPQMRKLLHLAAIRTVKQQGDLQTFISWVNNPKGLEMKGAYLENSAAGIINRLEKLLFGNTGRCFTVTSSTFDISQLLSRNTIIDLSGFEALEDQMGRRIFLEVVFQYLYYFVRSFRPPIKEESLPKNVFILDEIQKLVPPKSYRSRTPESMIGRGPWTLRAYDISMIFIGTDPIIDQPMLTNTGVTAIFFTRYDPYAISNLLGISKNEYVQLRNLLKSKHDERRCIISIDGSISLLKTHEFILPVENLIQLNDLQNRPLQQELRNLYNEFRFNPI